MKDWSSETAISAESDVGCELDSAVVTILTFEEFVTIFLAKLLTCGVFRPTRRTLDLVEIRRRFHITLLADGCLCSTD